MKKISIFLLAAFAIVACSNSRHYTTQTVNPKTQIDSLNYFAGYMTGLQIKMMFLSNDSTAESVDAFVGALEDSYNGIEVEAEAYDIDEKLVNNAQMCGRMIREQERESGLMGIDGLETDFDLIRQGFINGLYLDTANVDPNAIATYMNETLQPLAEAQMAKEAENAQTEGKAFLEENAKRPEVKTTASGLQYEVLVQGEGAKPTAESTVKVHYEGKLVNGEIFDSSYQRGEPIEFPLNGVIKGWTEGLQLMPVGSTYMLYIPYQLGYGERGAGGAIPPFATLIFKVELLEIK